MMSTEREQAERTGIVISTTVMGGILGKKEAIGNGKIYLPGLSCAAMALDTLGRIATHSSDGKLTGRDLAEATGEVALP